MKNTLYWHDYETFGATPKYDRPSQFAGIRTDEDLNIIGEPLMIYCKPSNDFLPHPMACKVTGITPLDIIDKGLKESDFIDAINKELSKAGTCGVGYNSINFDDEVTRYTLYRNLQDPYAREWKNNCSRWDIMNMLRLVSIKAPETLNWPINENGFKSFRLEELSKSNNIIHENAHDALSDVIATIEIAKIIKKNQPKLYSYVYNLRNKNEAMKVLDNTNMLIHVDSFYGGDKNYFSIVHPLCSGKKYSSLNNNDYILVDLTREDFIDWINLPLSELKNQLFSKKEKLEELNLKRPGINKIAANRCPVVVNYKVLSEQQLADFNIDINVCLKNLAYLTENPDVADNISKLFVSEFENDINPDTSLYGSFISNTDRALLDYARINLKFHEDYQFSDNKFHELLFRYQARNYPETLTVEETSNWNNFRFNNIINGENFTIQQFSDECINTLEEFPDTKNMILEIINYGQLIGNSEIRSILENLKKQIAGVIS